MISVTRVSLLGLAASCFAATALAAVKPAAIFCNHAVLQQGMAAPVWGTDTPEQKVTVRFAGQEKATVAGADGKWMVRLDPLPASAEGRPLTIMGSSTATIADVLVGEVWLCSGQSNMQFVVGAAKNGGKEAAAANFPAIRHMTVSNEPADEPQADVYAMWTVCAPGLPASRFSAVAYFFGREIHQRLEVPVGLIHSSWGGTNIQAWSPRELLMATPEGRQDIERQEKLVAGYDAAAAEASYKKAMEKWERDSKAFEALKAEGKATGQAPFKPAAPVHPTKDYRRPSGMYNGRIAPVIPYAIRGAIWYQGEGNANMNGAWRYRQMLPAMISAWRKAWGQGDFPFLWVQLPNMKGDLATAWPCMRESMLDALRTPSTGMAVTIDLGDDNNIHPNNKQEVGLRLALAALHVAYEKDLVYSGPLFQKANFSGGECALVFQHVGGGLVCKGERLTGFEIAGADRKFVPAEARIVGEQVVVSSAVVASPVAVRYAWSPSPPVSLYNREGLPASPFRTDDWPVAGQAATKPAAPGVRP